MKGACYASAMDLCCSHKGCGLPCQFESLNFSVQKAVLPDCSHFMHAESLLESLLEWTNCGCLQIRVRRGSVQTGPRVAPTGGKAAHDFQHTARAFTFLPWNQKLDRHQGSHLACQFHIEISLFLKNCKIAATMFRTLKLN